MCPCSVDELDIGSLDPWDDPLVWYMVNTRHLTNSTLKGNHAQFTGDTLKLLLLPRNECTRDQLLDTMFDALLRRSSAGLTDLETLVLFSRIPKNDQICILCEHLHMFCACAYSSSMLFLFQSAWVPPGTPCNIHMAISCFCPFRDAYGVPFHQPEGLAQTQNFPVPPARH